MRTNIFTRIQSVLSPRFEVHKVDNEGFIATYTDEFENRFQISNVYGNELVITIIPYLPVLGNYIDVDLSDCISTVTSRKDGFKSLKEVLDESFRNLREGVLVS